MKFPNVIFLKSKKPIFQAVFYHCSLTCSVPAILNYSAPSFAPPLPSPPALPSLLLPFPALPSSIFEPFLSAMHGSGENIKDTVLAFIGLKLHTNLLGFGSENRKP